jgi:NAD(P)-dependent dehydrogenase (short-subunit alcohol dehydrogenase family)
MYGRAKVAIMELARALARRWKERGVHPKAGDLRVLPEPVA